MRLRLTHVLVLMALVLGAGVLSVQGLEAYVGATSVPGLVAIDVPGLDPAMLADLGRGRGGPAWFAVRAGDEPCAPFDRTYARRAARGGSSTLLLSSAPLADEPAARDGWGVVIAPRLPVTAGTLAPAPTTVGPEAGFDASDPGALAERLARFVEAQHGTRPFVAGLRLRAADAQRLGEVIDPLLDAAARLPPYRRTSVVVLGAHLPDATRRVALRFDVGRWEGHVRPALADLLEDIP